MARKPQLDGLRWFLFVLVFVVHHYPDKFDYFGYALPVFFVLSGFLITRVLLASEQLGTRDGLKHFYIRRSLRIFPAYYAVVIVLWLTGSLSFPFYTLTYLLNIKLFALSVGPDASAYVDWIQSNFRSKSLHLWSLSVEEQYYLLYPILLFTTLVRYQHQNARGDYRVQHHFARVVPFILSELILWISDNALGSISAGEDCLLCWRERQAGIPEGGLDLVCFEYRHLCADKYRVRPFHGGFVSSSNDSLPNPYCGGAGIFYLEPVVGAGQQLDCAHSELEPFVFLGEMSYALYLWHLFSWGVYYYISKHI